ncbi:dTMP kinase [Viridibacillus arvi]|uniref:dTMP kinase n=1 Tax=Viridibacillus arvi TaxID=263475 RepID=UPI0034CE4561
MILKNGLFITGEGIEAGGKSTVLEKVASRLEEIGVPYIRTREPGGTRIAEQLRAIVLDPNNDIHLNTEIMLYACSRSEHIHSLVLPALKEGKVVICDRYIDSSIAYQGYGAGHSEEVIRKIKAVSEFATNNLLPDRTYLFDIPLEESFKRMGLRSLETQTDLDRIEQRAREYHQRVYDGYHHIAKQEPNRVVVIDGTQSRKKVFESVWNDLEVFLYKNSQ